MKTHRLLLSLTAVLLVLLPLSLSSCCEDIDFNEIDNPSIRKTAQYAEPDTVPQYVQLRFVFKVTQDMLNYCDVVVKYSDGKEIKTDTVNSTSWKALVKVQLPATLIFNREVKLKECSHMADAAAITFTNSYNMQYEILNSSSEGIGKGAVTGEGGSATFTGERVASIVNSGGLNISQRFKIDEMGERVY